MPALSHILSLDRCPYCSVANPNLVNQSGQIETADHEGNNHRFWGIYRCGKCGGLVTAWAWKWAAEVEECYPPNREVSPDIPARARSYLQQANDSIHAPAGAVMLSASAVDEMLKAKGLTTGTLYTRIDQAAANHLFTSEMAAWAHDVRLDANDQRHADAGAAMPTSDDASRAVDFALALAEFLFVLPNRVQRGRTHP